MARVADTVVALMIEKRGAVEALDEILALPRRRPDPVRRASTTRSASVESGRRTAPRSVAVRERVIERCHAMGVAVRAEIATPDEAERYRELGVKHFSLGVEIAVLYDWWSANGRRLREIVTAP